MEKTATPQAKPKNKHFWNFQPASGDNPPELILYGDIASETWWGDEVTPRQFTEELDALGAVPEIVVRINSGGGDVFAANAIYTRLKDNAAKITVKIDGWAASAATIIAMAGDSIEIPGNGVFMVHDPALGLLGYFNETELAKMTDELKVIKQSIVNAYTMKTGKDAADVAAIMAAETWYDGKQAVDAGFCDKLMFEDAETTVENAAKVVVNSVSLDLTRFPNMPVSLLNRMTARTPGGFSNKTNHKNTEKERNTMDGIEKITTVDGLKAAFPDLTRQIEDAATTAERKRIQDIEDVALAGYESIVNDAKFNNPIAAGDVAKAIVAAQKKQGGTYTTRRRAVRATLERAHMRAQAMTAATMTLTRPLTSCSPRRSKGGNTMYEIQKDQSVPVKFFAGEYPVVTAVKAVATGKSVKQYEPVKLTDSGIEPVVKVAASEAVSGTSTPAKSEYENTTAGIYGIAATAAEAAEEVVVYLTGEFFADAITLPEGVTADTLAKAFRNIGIFLK